MNSLFIPYSMNSLPPPPHPTPPPSPLPPKRGGRAKPFPLFWGRRGVGGRGWGGVGGRGRISIRLCGTVIKTGTIIEK